MTDADLNRGALEPTPSWLKPAPAPAPVTPPAPSPAPITYSAPAPTPATYSSPTTYSAPTTQAWSGFLGGAAPTDTQKAYAQSKGISFDQAAYELGKSQTNNTTTAPTPAPTTSTTPTTTGTGLQGQAPSEQVKEYAVQKGISFDQAYNELSSSGQIKEAPKVTDPLSQNKVSGTDIRIPNVLNDVNFNTGKTGNLTDKQKSELQIAWDRASSGNANQEDYNNLKNAIENLGWKPTVTTDAARIASEKAASDKAKADADAAAATATAKSFQDKIDATNKALDENYTKITNLIDSLAKGTIALTANQQTLIDSIQTNLVKATAAQKTANANYEAGLTQAGISAGRNRYAPEIEMGNIYNAINLGASKINDLDAAAVAKKAELMEQFQTNNYQNAITGYKELQSILKDKEDTIIKMEIMARDYAKEARDEEYRATQDKIDTQTKMLDKGYSKVSPNDPRLLDPDADVVVLGNDIYIRDVVSTVDPTNDIKEYEYAVNNGFNGTFMDYLSQKSNMKTPANTVTDSEILSYAKYLQSQDYTLSDQDALNNARMILNNQQTNQGGDTSNKIPGGATGKTVISNGVTFDIGTYATDPNHEASVANILNRIGKMNSVEDINAYIQKVAPGSAVTGEMIAEASSKYNIPWEIQMAMMQQDSNFGTAGKGARTFNPGNVGNTDSGAEVNYGNWQSGVDALASNLSRRIVGGTSENKTTNYVDVLKKNQNTILSSIPTTERSQFMQGLIKSASSGDKEQIKEAIYNGLVENSKQGLNLAEERNKFETVGTIESAFKDFYNKGGKTNLISGTFSNILNKLGTSKDAATQELLGKLTQIKQQYRNAITGAAWGAQEDIEYNNLLGSLTSDKTKNLSALGGAVSAAKSSYNNKLKTLTGKEVYNQFFIEPKVVKDRTEVSNMNIGEQFTYNGKTYEVTGSNSFKEIQ